MKPFHILFLISLILIVSGCTQAPAGEVYSVSDYGLVSYTGRPPANYTKTFWNETENSVIYKIGFRSRNASIYGLLAFPKTCKEGCPAFLVLPAAGVTKEGEQKYLSHDLNKWGFITLTLDTRGQGESIAFIPSLSQEYQTFLSGGEPVQHRMIYDALSGYDILKSLPETDKGRIYAAGESAGGRFAAIAAATEPGISAALLISTSGYDFEPAADPELARFENSINPDAYISRISPGKTVMMHSTGDKIIPISLARKTFSLAKEPKKFLEINGTAHGYYRKENQEQLLEEELKSWL